MNYETEYELGRGARVTVDYEVVWDEDNYGDKYHYTEINKVWALLRDSYGVADVVDVWSVLHWRDIEEIENHCEKHCARMMEEDAIDRAVQSID